MLSPLLYSLFTHDCTARLNSNTIINFADDTTVVGLITDNNETAYREEVRDLAVWCKDNNLSLSVIKTKEMSYLGVHITNKLTWFKHTKTVVKRAQQNLFPLRKIWYGSSDPQKVLQLHHQEHPDRFHHRLVWQLLGIRP